MLVPYIWRSLIPSAPVWYYVPRLWRVHCLGTGEAGRFVTSLQITYYDKYGSRNNILFLFNGHVAAFVVEGAVYSKLGIQTGWISNGWIRGLDGNAAFFAEGAFGVGPSIPYRQALPIRQDKVPFSMPLIRKNSIERPIDKITWSPLSGKSFF